jgi:hypothetical protein
VLSINIVHYVERAAYSTDAEVKEWIKESIPHKTTAIVVAPRRAHKADLSSVELRAQRGFVKRNESEQGLVMNKMQPMQSPKGAANDPIDIIRAQSISSRMSLARYSRKNHMNVLQDIMMVFNLFTKASTASFSLLIRSAPVCMTSRVSRVTRHRSKIYTH